MTADGRRLRLRLALVGLIGVVTPLLVLLAVAAWTTEDVRVGADGSTVSERGGLSWWIPVTVTLLVVPAAAVAWWWAGREVALHTQAAEAVEEQRRLIEDASHRLRTPIAVLLANADVTLVDPNPSIEELRTALETSRSTAAAMQLAVEGLLGEARGRRLDAERSTTDVVAIVAHACTPHLSHAAAKNVAIRRTGPGRLTASVDAASLERAIEAIVDNAVRLSPPGAEVIVSIAGDDEIATIGVSDQGSGISDADHPHVFERYWTTDPSHSGIGLDVVAEAARGAFEVIVESPLTELGGTRFTLVIPRQRTE